LEILQSRKYIKLGGTMIIDDFRNGKKATPTIVIVNYSLVDSDNRNEHAEYPSDEGMFPEYRSYLDVLAPVFNQYTSHIPGIFNNYPRI
jgi:hypothetical protein